MNGKIIKEIDDKHYILNIGSDDGVNNGDQFVICGNITDINDPDSNLEIEDYQIVKGKMIIVSLKNNMSIGELLYSPNMKFEINSNLSSSSNGKSSFAIQIGDIVKKIEAGEIIDPIIEPERIKPGGEFKTRVRFKGFVINGFFDNAIFYPKSDGQGIMWNPDPNTWDEIRDTGKLQEYVDIPSEWSCVIPKSFQKGKYVVSVRVYEDPLGIPKIGRQIIAKEELKLIVE